MAVASSSSVPALELCDVFVSFRAEDTLNNFVCHLHEALDRKKIRTYIGEDSVGKGNQEISPPFLKAIQESKVSVIVFSENYASSSGCLEELNHVLQCRETNKQLVVIPVFYHIIPSHVRKQKESFATAFGSHKECFKNEMFKVDQWRTALTKAANFSGWDSSAVGSESELVEAIVKDIMEKLHHMSSTGDSKGLVGVERRLKQIVPLLGIGSSDVRIIGICGMGGIGKTTLARVVFKPFASQFEGSYFLSNVKEQANKHGLTYLRNKLISELLKDKNLNVDNSRLVLLNRLRCAKVLVVLDDIDNEQLEHLVEDRDFFGRGTRIIITSQDPHIFEVIGADATYKVEELNFDEALQLFYSKSFRGNSPTSNYIELSQRVVNYAKGVPSVLKVLGCRLCSRSTIEWESELNKLESQVHKMI